MEEILTQLVDVIKHIQDVVADNSMKLDAIIDILDSKRISFRESGNAIEKVESAVSTASSTAESVISDIKNISDNARKLMQLRSEQRSKEDHTHGGINAPRRPQVRRGNK